MGNVTKLRTPKGRKSRGPYVGFPGKHGALLNFSDWLYKSTFTIDTSAFSGDLANIAVRVYLDAATYDFTKMQSNGKDLRFTDKNNHLLKYEIEYFDSVNQEAVCWVLLPAIDADNNYFYMYYGNTDADDSQSAEALWQGAGAIAVWHFSEDSGAAVIDSSATGADGTMINVNTTPQRERANGVSSLQLNKHKIGSHEMGNEKVVGGNAIPLTQLTGDFTVSVYYKLKDAVPLMSTSTYSILSVGPGPCDNLFTQNFSVNIAQSDQRPYIHIGDGILTGRIDTLLLAEWRVTGMPLDVWHNFIGYLSGDYIRCFFDGSNELENPPFDQQRFSVNGGVRQSGNMFGIGFPWPITADIDEIKVFNRAITQDEAKVEAMNQQNTLLTVYDTQIEYPDVPSALSLTLLSDGVKLDFTDNSSGLAKTEIWGKSDSGSYERLTTLAEGVETYTDLSVSVGLRYYKIRSRRINTCSDFVEETINITAPDAPTELTLTLISGGVKIDFTDATDGLASHEIWGKSDSGSYERLTTLTPGTVTFSDTTSPVDLRYYRVRSKYLNAYSDYVEDSIAMLGPELTENGDFSNNTYWLSSGAQIIDGVLRYTNAALNTGRYKQILTIGKKYRIRYKILNYVSGTFKPLIAGIESKGANGTYEDIVVSDTTYLLLYATNNNTTLDVDDVSVKEVLSPV